MTGTVVLQLLCTPPTRTHPHLSQLGTEGWFSNVKVGKSRLAKHLACFAHLSPTPLVPQNEIHGSWFGTRTTTQHTTTTRMQPSHRNPTDRKNRVLMTDDDLRPDLLERAESWADKADLCIAMGTSLCGSMLLQPPSRLDRSCRVCLLTATAWLARPHSDC